MIKNQCPRPNNSMYKTSAGRLWPGRHSVGPRVRTTCSAGRVHDQNFCTTPTQCKQTKPKVGKSPVWLQGPQEQTVLCNKQFARSMINSMDMQHDGVLRRQGSFPLGFRGKWTVSGHMLDVSIARVSSQGRGFIPFPRHWLKTSNSLPPFTGKTATLFPFLFPCEQDLTLKSHTGRVTKQESSHPTQIPVKLLWDSDRLC